MKNVLVGKDDAILEAIASGLSHDKTGELLGCNGSSITRRLRAIGEERARSVYAQPNEDASFSNAHWSDASWEGWQRVENVDEVETVWVTKRNGDEESYTVDLLDPGVQYPPGWDGPRLRDRRTFKVRPHDGVKRTFVTGVQDKTPLHGPFMVNLEADAAYLGASIVAIGDTYNKDWWGAIFGADGRDKRKNPARIRPYSSYIADRIHSRRLDIAKIQVCAEVNIIPTADRPLTGLLTYGKGRPAVFSSPKQEMESIPRAPHLDPVTAWTTGYATPPNYVQRKAGLKAKFHHVIGAVLIEEDVDGTVHLRHIHADPETGAYQDLDRKVERGVVSTGHRVRAINYGCCHIEHLDPVVAEGTWHAPLSIQNVLRPEEVFVHDVLDFYSQNHHNRADPWHAATILKKGLTVAQEIRNVARFFASILAPGTKVNGVESNHDLALARWVREADWKQDLLNAPLQLELALTQANAIAAGEDISLFEIAVKRASDVPLDAVNFLREDESYTIDGVQFGWHGHNGPNGSRGTTQAFLRVATKMSKAHDHTPAKRQGVVSAGTKQRINPMPKWAKGPTSWAHADVVHYDGGRSSHVFYVNGKWRAEGNRVARGLQEAA